MATRKKAAAKATPTKGPLAGLKYEGREVVGTGIKIRKAGDGLSAAMKVEPKVLAIGDEGYLVLEYVVVAVDHPAEDRKDPAIGGVQRIHILDAGTATFVDAELVEGLIDEQREKNALFAAEQAGQHTLADVALLDAHDAGEHPDGGVPHCALCAAEAEEAAALAGYEAKAKKK